MLKKTLIVIVISLLCFGCFTDDVKKKMDSVLKESQDMMADHTFKTALYSIEMHKVRYGVYPETLRELKFLTMSDSSFFHAVEYQKLDKGYELNLRQTYASVSGQTDITINLDYPDEFWQGLGCEKSNMKAGADDSF